MQKWQVELAKSISNLDELAKFYPAFNTKKLSKVNKNFGLLITPEYLKILKKEKFSGPVTRQLIPNLSELKTYSSELSDPIGDYDFSPVKGLVHRYPDRVLIWPTKNCAIHCRFCFRRNFVRSDACDTESVFMSDQLADTNCWALTANEISNIISYIKRHKEIEEVIFSGGDPFMLTDEQIKSWLTKINAIKHIKRIRFHTRIFTALPSRITESLLKILGKYNVNILIHINHPAEITPTFLKAIKRARKSGLLLFSQSVLLKKVNNSVEVLKELFTSLLDLGIKPYYLHHTDMVSGTSHFRVSVLEGKKLLNKFQGTISGLAMPKYMIEIPTGKGKVPIDLGLYK